MRTNKSTNEKIVNSDDYKLGYKNGLYTALLILFIFDFIEFMFIYAERFSETKYFLELLMK